MAENDGKIIIGIQADINDIKAKLLEVEKEGKKAAGGIGNAFQAVAGAIAGAKIFGAFKSALDEANKLEASLNRVESAARSFGQSTAKAKEAAIAMAKDGFLSLNESAQAFSTTMALGLNLDQSKKFIDAAKDVASFGNTIGNASESVVSGLKGILTGSSELTENMSPKMKSLSMAYTVNKNKMGEAKAMNILYNETLKLQNSYLGDSQRYLDTAAAAQKRFTAATDSASAAIGKALQPAMKSLFNTLTGIVEGVTKFFTSLDGSTQLVLVMGAAVASLSGVLVALLPVLRAISLSNPFGWITLAIVGFTALIALSVEFQNKYKPENIVKAYKESAKALADLGSKADELSKINKRTAAEEKDLIEVKEALRKKARELGVDYDKLAKSGKSYLDIAKELAGLEKTKTKGDLYYDYLKLKKDKASLDDYITKATASGKSTPGLEGTSRSITGKMDAITAAMRKLDDDEKEAAKTGKPVISGGGKASPEFRFIEARDELKKLKDEYDIYIKKVGIDSDKGQEATKKLSMAQRGQIDDIRIAYAEYIEDRTTAEAVARNKEYDAVVSQLMQKKNLGMDVEKELHEARIAFAKREADARLKSFADTASAANTIAGGVGSIAKAKDLGSGLAGGGGILSGVGQLGDRYKAFWYLGQAVGAIGGIVSTFTGLFEKSDEERKREADRAEDQRREQLAILELQANYQKNLLELQESQANLPFAELRRKMRLVDIEAQQSILSGGSETAVLAEASKTKLGLVGSTLTTQSAKIGQGLLGSGVTGTAESLTAYLTRQEGQAPLIKMADSLIAGLEDYARGNPTYFHWSVFLDTANKISSLALQQTVKSAYIEHIGAIGKNAVDNYVNLYPGRYNEELRQYGYQNLSQAIGIPMSSNYGALSSLLSENRIDTSIAEESISLIEQQNSLQLEISKNTRKTADNTSRLTQMREASILDLAGGGIRGFGSFFRTTAGNAFNSINSVINPSMPAMQTPSAISNSLSIATLTRGWQERTADGIESLVRIQTEALQLLAEIALNSNRAGDVGGSLSEAELLNIMSKVRSRLV